MADRKVSDMTVATSVAASDLLYVVVGGASKSITLTQLFGNLPVPVVGKSFRDNSTPQNISATGTAIDLAVPTTKVNAGASVVTVTLGAGTEGQIKTIVLYAKTGGSVQINGTFAGATSVVLTNIGDAAVLHSIGSTWFIVGGTNTKI